MSSNFAILGLAMAAAGVLTDVVGSRWVLVGAGAATFVASGVALVMTRWLPVIRADEDEVLDAQAAAAASHLAPAVGARPAVSPKAARDGSAKSGLERIAVLLEEIEARRAREAQRSPTTPD
jgi:hypothetical protein